MGTVLFTWEIPREKNRPQRVKPAPNLYNLNMIAKSLNTTFAAPAL